MLAKDLIKLYLLYASMAESVIVQPPTRQSIFKQGYRRLPFYNRQDVDKNIVKKLNKRTKFLD